MVYEVLESDRESEKYCECLRREERERKGENRRGKMKRSVSNKFEMI